MSASNSDISQGTAAPASSESVSDRLAGSAHEAVDRAAERAKRAEETIRQSAMESSRAAHEKVDAARQELDVLAGKVERYVKSNPVTAAGVAFAAGVLLSSLLRR